MTWKELRGWLIPALLGALGFFAIRTMDRVEGTISQMAASVQELNVKIGTVMAVQSGELQKTQDHEVRIRKLEGMK